MGFGDPERVMRKPFECDALTLSFATVWFLCAVILPIGLMLAMGPCL